MSNVLRNLPSVNELLESPPLKSLLRQVNQSVVTSGVRSFLDRLRTDVQNASGIQVPSANELAERIAKWIASGPHRTLQPRINATGTLLHPSLGGPPLADEALQAIASIGANYTSTSIMAHRPNVGPVERLLTQFTGAEAALVVASGAAANLLVLSALSAGRETIVARNELIDTGDGYCVAGLLTAAAATLREVGASNRVSVDDYAAAFSTQTALFLKVHSSGFQQIGDVAETPLQDLAPLARRLNLPLAVDAGAGALIEFEPYGVHGEPVVGDLIRAGADLVLFRGDKLLGGPPCGIIVGRQTLVERLAQHPLMRAIAAEKLTLAGLHATLELYGSMDVAERSIPLLTLLSTPLDNLKNRAERLAPQIQATSAVASASAVEDETFLAGVALPRHRVPTWCVAISPAEGTAELLQSRLEASTPAIVGRLARGRLIVDLRSVRARHDQEIVTAFQLLSSTFDAAASSNREPQSG